MNTHARAIIKLNPEFEPKFGRFESAEECAHAINRPHDDYPALVDETLKLIEATAKIPVITVWDIFTVHSAIGVQLGLRHQDIGGWRSHQAYVVRRDGTLKYMPPGPSAVAELIHDIFPVRHSDDLETWYRAFQIIHPFSDGNGRCAGIVYSALKYQQTGLWFAPKQ